MDGLLLVGWLSSVVAAGVIGYGIGKMVGYDEGWDEAANMPPSRLKLAKDLWERMRDRGGVR